MSLTTQLVEDEDGLQNTMVLVHTQNLDYDPHQGKIYTAKISL